MRIVYVGKHGQANSNDDEGAVVYALRQLGHEVICCGEGVGARIRRELPADLLLFNKWEDAETLESLRGKLVRAFWYWDLVDFPDPTLTGRCRARVEWMGRMLPHVEFGFCTDGDWVAERCFARLGGGLAAKLHWLPQGFDERLANLLPLHSRCDTCDGPLSSSEILFTGIARGGGQRRMSFVEEMRARYGPAFRHVSGGIHGQALADLVRGAQVVVAPDSPVTDRYASNRIYLMLGLGAFLLHPYSEHLLSRYEHGREVIYYRGREEMHRLIDRYLHDNDLRRQIADAGRARTLAQHTYRQRVEELLRIVQAAQ